MISWFIISSDCPGPIQYQTENPQHTIAIHFDGKSIAVENRCMFMNMAFGADISIECFARNLYDQGCMTVIHDHTKD
jgi:hypothetical protein